MIRVGARARRHASIVLATVAAGLVSHQASPRLARADDAPAAPPAPPAAPTAPPPPPAEPAGTSTPASATEGARREARPHRHDPSAQEAREAAATLRVTPGALGTPWTLEVTNVDSTPLRFVADTRLIWLDVTPGESADDDDEEAPRHGHAKKARLAARCTLPAELRPATDGERVRVLAPGASVAIPFDPRLYCFDSHDAATLVPGSHVVVHMGWPERALYSARARSAPPFVLDESFEGDARSGVKELSSQAIVTPGALPESPASEHPHRLVVTTVKRLDAEAARDLVVEVTVENTTSRPLHLMLRPETLAFDVSSPRGVFACVWRTPPASPIAEVFTTIQPRAKATSSVLLPSVCPDGTFAHAGLYTVQARLDTRRASGAPIGLDTFDGVVEASTPILVRLRHDPAARP